MGFWDNVKDGFASGQMGRGPNYVRKQREQEAHRLRQEQVVIDLATLQAFLNERQVEYNKIATAERSRGNRNYPNVTLEISQLGNQLAVTRYSMNGDHRRIEIFYGGAGSNPLNTPDHDYHGHIVIDDDHITSWLEPGPKNRRNVLY